MSQLAGSREVEQVEQLHLEESVEEGTSERKSSVGHCQGCGSLIRFRLLCVDEIQQVVDEVGLSHAASPGQWAEWGAILAACICWAIA